MLAIFAAVAALTAPPQEASVLAACRAWMAPLSYDAELTVKAVDGGLCLNGMMDKGADRVLLNALKPFDAKKPLVIVVRSGGGEAAATLTMAEAIQPRTVTVIADGLCASSCADYILPAGKRRVVEPGTLLLYHGGVVLDQLNQAAPQVAELARKDPHLDYDHAIEQDRLEINSYIARQEALLVKEGISPSLFRWMDLINHMSLAEQRSHCPADTTIIAYPPQVLARFGLTFDSYGGPRSQAEVDDIVRKAGHANAHICYWQDTGM